MKCEAQLAKETPIAILIWQPANKCKCWLFPHGKLIH